MDQSPARDNWQTYTLLAERGWFAARPSGAEDMYKIHAENLRGADHLRRILEEAQAMVDEAWAATPDRRRNREPTDPR